MQITRVHSPATASPHALPPAFATGSWSGGQIDADGCFRLEAGRTRAGFASLDDARSAAGAVGTGVAIMRNLDQTYNVVELLLRTTDHPTTGRHVDDTVSIRPFEFPRGMIDLPASDVGDLSFVELISGAARVVPRAGRLVDG